MIQSPPLPLAVRTANRTARALGRVGLKLAKLEEESLLAEARRKAGLSDFGPDGFRGNLRRLLQALEAEAELSLLGRFITRVTLVNYLVNRLRIVDCHRRNPEIAREPIRRPVFIIGMPRTGTSILHELLALDPATRTPRSWEVIRSVPPPEKATFETDPRIAEEEARFAQTDRLIPDFKRIHRLGAQLPQECVVMMNHDFASMENSVVYAIPSYTRWMVGDADLGPTYRFHRMQAQLLQWKCPGEQWVFKSPCHLWRLPALLAEYPDAVLVQTHRDPLKVLASNISLTVVVRALFSDRVDAAKVSAECAETDLLALNRSVDARVNGLVDPSSVVDLQFRDFMADPVAVVRSLYARCERTLSPEAEARMRRYLAENPADKHGKHSYTFADTGLDLEAERARVRRYQEHFGVPTEPV